MTLRSRITLTAVTSVLTACSCFAQAPTSTLTPAVATPTRTSLAVDADGLSAQVADTLGHPVTRGTVSFLIDSRPDAGALGRPAGTAPAQSLGSAILDDQGHAALALPKFPTQARIVAVYTPAPADATVSPSSSAATTVTADATGVPDFTVTASPSSITTVQGSYATSQVTVTPLNNFEESITLSCSNLPGQAFCTFTPVIGTTAPTGTQTGAQPFTSNLQISTQAASGAVAPPDFGRPARSNSTRSTALAILLPGFLALAGFAAARRRAFAGGRALALAAGLALAAAAVLGATGCSQRYGYLKHPPPVAGGTPLGTYSINIAASGNNGSSVTSHNINITLAVTAP